jgi:hypothetical protein
LNLLTQAKQLILSAFASLSQKQKEKEEKKKTKIKVKNLSVGRKKKTKQIHNKKGRKKKKLLFTVNKSKSFHSLSSLSHWDRANGCHFRDRANLYFTLSDFGFPHTQPQLVKYAQRHLVDETPRRLTSLPFDLQRRASQFWTQETDCNPTPWTDKH